MSQSTVYAVLERHGLVKRRKRKRYRAQDTELSHARRANVLWCADYKGEYLLGNKRYCYPLTITDYKIRYLLVCDALDSTKGRYAITVFERTFQEFVLADAIRMNNSTPFASRTARFGLSKLPVFWLRLGINIERTHQALNMKYPGELYTPSPRVYQSPDEPEYPFHDRTVRVTNCQA
ncbi:MAG: hypothetical protein ACR2PZ_11245 [Pseudomonadales bacterium]